MNYVSPRKRRVRHTIQILAIILLAGSLVGGIAYVISRPAPYRPDESNQDITRRLEQQLPPNAPLPKWRDVTADAGLASFKTFLGSRTSQLPEDMGPGLAWGDFDNDGDEDLFLVSAGGPLIAAPDELAESELYENLGNGVFQKAENFPELRIHGMGAAWGDYDGDGYVDLVVTGYQALLLFHNEGGTGRFTRDEQLQSQGDERFWAGAAWGDYNNDRSLDLYVCGYVDYKPSEGESERISRQLGTVVPYTLNPASYSPIPNLLFRNNNDGTFTELAAQEGVNNRNGRSLCALWHDFDDDGWLDLYVANDISDNVFFHNRNGSFHDISHPAIVADYRSAMGLAPGDFDRDGDDDLFITHWVAQENALYQNLLQEGHLNHKQANTPSPLRFLDAANLLGLGQNSLPSVGWGTEFVDLDADGWLDLVVANGHTLEEPEREPKQLQAQAPFLYWNQKGQFFYNLAPAHSLLAVPHVSRGLACADFNNDGAIDLAMSHLEGSVQLLRNEMQQGHFLKVCLHSLNHKGQHLASGEGAKVFVCDGSTTLRRTVSSSSYLSQSSRILHFGLGEYSRVKEMEVRWLGGATNYYYDLAANTTWHITEGCPVPSQVHEWNAFTPNPRKKAIPSEATNSQLSQLEKTRLTIFWQLYRKGMEAFKQQGNITKAEILLRQALTLDPHHEEALFQMAMCLKRTGRMAEALEQLERLKSLNPQSHRAWQQWAICRAISANSKNELKSAENALLQAHQLNPEETGVLQLLGEVCLLQGEFDKAAKHLSAACISNSKAQGAYFLRAYIAWKQRQTDKVVPLLRECLAARGPEWKPSGSTAEGDSALARDIASTPLTIFWKEWSGAVEAQTAFEPLETYLSSKDFP